ncbi:unnamed protein product [Vicia faba]|uniref:Pentatricopeptide repeat-containing protein n=1 Tax=Vicia faba TaxID=3906 RepID=A0AAV0YFA3_VICFA|nr:unnamed protein product [Vicia faba]
MHTNAVSLDTYALCTTLTASSKLQHFNFGKRIHAHVTKSGFFSSVFVATALIHYYSKSINVKDAALVFDEIPDKNTVCANALLSGYSQAGLWIKGVQLVRKMPVLKLKYDHFMCLHWIISVLVQMYGKCGMVEKARLVFKLDGMEIQNETTRNLVLWTSMLGVYGKNGRYKEVIDLYREMLQEEIKPDGII